MTKSQKTRGSTRCWQRATAKESYRQSANTNRPFSPESTNQSQKLGLLTAVGLTPAKIAALGHWPQARIWFGKRSRFSPKITRWLTKKSQSGCLASPEIYLLLSALFLPPKLLIIQPQLYCILQYALVFLLNFGNNLISLKTVSR